MFGCFCTIEVEETKSFWLLILIISIYMYILSFAPSTVVTEI